MPIDRDYPPDCTHLSKWRPAAGQVDVFGSPLGYSDPGLGLAGTWKSPGHVEITSARQPPAGGVDFRHAGTKQW